MNIYVLGIVIHIGMTKSGHFLTDRPTSVHNRCVTEVFGGVFVLSLCLLKISVGVRAFVIGFSQISSFLSFN